MGAVSQLNRPPRRVRCPLPTIPHGISLSLGDSAAIPAFGFSRHSPALSLPAVKGEVEGPLAPRHCNSNRHKNGLEMPVTPCVINKNIVSNRHRFGGAKFVSTDKSSVKIAATAGRSARRPSIQLRIKNRAVTKNCNATYTLTSWARRVSRFQSSEAESGSSRTACGRTSSWSRSVASATARWRCGSRSAVDWDCRAAGNWAGEFT
jgi:hypothetical protein